MVVFCAAAGDGTGSPTSQTISGNNSGAYTSLTFQSATTVTYDSFSQVNYIIQGGTVDTSLTIPSSANARNAQRWVVHVFRGVDSTTPMDVTATYATGTGTGRPNPAAIVPTTAGAWICAFYTSSAATGTAYTAPTDFATDWLGGTTSDTADVMTGGGYYTGWTSGSYDPAAITAGGTTNAADSWTATTIALKPFVAVAPTVTTQAVTDIAETTLTGNGNITATGGENATVRGFCYMTGTSGDPTTANSTASDSGSYSTGAYTKSITGLSAHTAYRVRAYATNSAGTSYGTTVQAYTTVTVALNSPADASSGSDTTPDLSFTGTSSSNDIRYNAQISDTTAFAGSGVATYYFDGSDASATDPNSVWTNDANAFDGSTGTYATPSVDGSTSSNYLMAEGTNAPATGGTITQVRARFHHNTLTLSGQDCYAAIYTDGLSELLGTPSETASVSAGYTAYTTLSTPTGGWTWAKVQALETKIYVVNNGGVGITRVEVEVTYSGFLTDAISGTDPGFSGSPDNTDPFASAQQVTYTVQSALADGTYYWRVRGIDPSGSNTYGAWSSTRSFTISAGPVNGSVTQVAQSMTLTGGTQTVSASALVNGSVTQVTANLSLNGGTQTVASKEQVAITQTTANLSLTGGTQTVASTSNASVTQTSQALTLTGGTQAVSASSIVNGSVTQVAGTLTLTGGTQSVASVQNASVTQTTANLVLGLGTQAVSATVISNGTVTQVSANLVLTGGTQVVASQRVASVAQIAANLVLTTGTQAVSTSSVVNGTVTQVAANLLLSGGTQSVVSAQFATVSQVAGSLALTGGIQTVAGQISTSVTQTSANLTLSTGTQVVSSSSNVSIVQSSANLTITPGMQAVSSANSTSVAQTAANLALTGGTQAVSTQQFSTISQTSANLALTGGTQSVSANSLSSFVNINQVGAFLTLTPGTQSVSSVVIANATVAQSAANLTLNTGTQAVLGKILINAAVTQVAANLTLTPGTQIVASVQNGIVNQQSVSLTLSGFGPVVTPTEIIILPTDFLTITQKKDTLVVKGVQDSLIIQDMIKDTITIATVEDQIQIKTVQDILVVRT